MLAKLATANKALVAALGAALTAAAPALVDAINQWVAVVVGLLLTGAATWSIPNKPDPNA
jgi:hypothetical protein